MPTSCLAQTCSLPAYLMTSSFKTKTITLPATLHEASQTPMGRGPEFLSYSIKQQDRKASIAWVSTRTVHKLLATL